MTSFSLHVPPAVRSAIRRWPSGVRRLALTVAIPAAAIAAAGMPAASAAVAAPAAGASAGAPASRAALAAPAAVPGPPSGWSTIFSDDFNGAAGSGADSQWMYDTGPGSNFGTGEIETMTNSTSNVHLDGNGNLDITALGSGSSWTSGRIQTTSANVGAPAGGELEVTASIQQPAGGPGYWQAFWMLGPGQWPENGEIDIMEDVNSLSEVSGTVHCGTDPGGPCNESNGIGSGLRSCGGCQSGYHTYTMILNRTNPSNESIAFYLDGNQYFTVTESQVGTSTWQAAFDHNMSVIFDLAMGGGYPNGQCGCTTPTSSTASGGTMSVAYVAAYTTTGGGGGGNPTGPITGYAGLCVDVRGRTRLISPRSRGTPATGPVRSSRPWCRPAARCTPWVSAWTSTAAAPRTEPRWTSTTATTPGAGVRPASQRIVVQPAVGQVSRRYELGDNTRGALQIWDCTGNANQKWKLP